MNSNTKKNTWPQFSRVATYPSLLPLLPHVYLEIKQHVASVHLRRLYLKITVFSKFVLCYMTAMYIYIVYTYTHVYNYILSLLSSLSELVVGIMTDMRSGVGDSTAAAVATARHTVPELFE